MPAPPDGIQRMRHFIAIQAADRKCDQRHRIACRRRTLQAIHPAQGFRPACNAGRAILALLDQRQVQLALLKHPV
ncbi:hypothetical protein D3C81_1840060 [compost metagenome]